MSEVFDELIAKGYGRASTRIRPSQLSCRTFVQQNLETILFSKNRERHLREIVICIGGFVGSDQDEALTISNFTQLQFFEPYDTLIFFVDKFDFLIQCVGVGICNVAEGFEARFNEVMLSVIVSGKQVQLELMPNPEKEELKMMKKEVRKKRVAQLEKARREEDSATSLGKPNTNSVNNNSSNSEKNDLLMISNSSKARKQMKLLDSAAPMKIEEFVPSSDESDDNGENNGSDDDEEELFFHQQLRASVMNTDEKQKFDPRKYTSSHDEHVLLLMEIGNNSNNNLSKNEEKSSRETTATNSININNSRNVSTGRIGKKEEETTTTTTAKTVPLRPSRKESAATTVEYDENGFIVKKEKVKVLDRVPERHSKVERKRWSADRFKEMIAEEELLLERDLKLLKESEHVNDENDDERHHRDSGVATQQLIKEKDHQQNDDDEDDIVLITKAEQGLIEAEDQRSKVVDYYNEKMRKSRAKRSGSSSSSL